LSAKREVSRELLVVDEKNLALKKGLLRELLTAAWAGERHARDYSRWSR